MRTDDVPECTREGVLKKSWKFYRRTGAIWTDGYHMPEHQRRWSERADLDAKHEAHVRRQMRREARAERERKADVKLRSKKIRSRLHLRQVENAERYGSLASPPHEGKTRRNSVHGEEKRSNHCSCDQGRGSKCTCKNRHHDNRDDKRWARERHSDNRETEAMRMANRKDQARSILAGKHARAPQRMHKLKTQDYYRGNGFLWSDMTHVPYERLHLVLDPRIIDKDREALERIDRRLEEEAEEKYQRACDMQRKIDVQRNHFRAQQDRNDRRASSAGLHVPQRLGRAASETQNFKGDFTAGDQALPGDQEQTMENKEVRAVPRLLGHPAAGKGAPVSEKSGLLHIDHVASRRLGHFWSLTASMKKRAGGKPGSAPGRQESVPDRSKVRDVDRQVMFVSAPLESASVAPGGEESIVFATRYDSDIESKGYCDGESDSDSDSELGKNILPFKGGVAPCQSLSAPAVVLLELDDFESRLRELEASGETRRPFWMDENEKK